MCLFQLIGGSDEAFASDGSPAASAAPSGAPAQAAASPPDPCGGLNNAWGFTDCRASAVQTFTGGWLYGHTDLAVGGPGPSLLFRRSYDNWDTRSLAGLGQGWMDNYAANLARAGADTQDLILDGPDGRSDRYTLNPDGSYTPPPAVYTTLVKNDDQGYTATLPNKVSWTFNNQGRLTRVNDSSGKQSILSYNAGGQLITVSDPLGRGALTFSYNTQGLITTISDWVNASQAVQFRYDAHARLHAVVSRDGETITYGYDGDSSRLTTIADLHAGAVVVSTYDPQGRVQTQRALFGLLAPQVMKFGYVAKPDGGQTTTTVYAPEPGGSGVTQTVVESFDAQGRILDRTSTSSATPIPESFTYDKNFNRTSVTTDQGTTTFCYDGDYKGGSLSLTRGDVTRRIDPPTVPGGSRPVTLFRYNANNALTEIVPPQAIGNGGDVTCTSDLSVLIDAAYMSRPT